MSQAHTNSNPPPHLLTQIKKKEKKIPMSVTTTGKIKQICIILGRGGGMPSIAKSNAHSLASFVDFLQSQHFEWAVTMILNA